MTGNVTGRTGRSSGVVRGGKSVFDQVHIQGRLTNGAVLSNPPTVGGVVFAGDICEFNYATKMAKCLRVYKLAAKITSASTKISFERGEYLHKPEVGMNIFPVPSAFNESAPYVTIGALTSETLAGGAEVYSFAITAGALGSVDIAAGTLFVVADSIGSIESYTITAAGTGYVAGDLITVVETGAENGVLKVETVGSGGEILTVSLVSKGTDYSASATARATTTDSTAGAGATVTVTETGGLMYVQNPNSVVTTDIPIDVTPATSASDYDGAEYFAPLFNICTILGSKVSPIPELVKGNLRKGYSDIKIFE